MVILLSSLVLNVFVTDDVNTRLNTHKKLARNEDPKAKFFLQLFTVNVSENNTLKIFK